MKKCKPMFISLVIALAAAIFSKVQVSAAQRTLAGNDRYGTAISIAKNGWTNSEYAVLAPGETDSMVDALAAAPLAKAYNAPILLTKENELNADTLGELKSLGVKTVFITSGIITSSVKNSLKDAGMSVEEVYGGNRYATSVAIANKVKTVKPITGSFVVNGNGKDALSAGAIAAGKGMVILYTYENELPEEVSNFLAANAGTNYVLGGTKVVSDNVMNSTKAVKRLYGTDRYGTSASLLNEFKADLDLSNIYISAGNDENLVDALTVSALAVKGTKTNPVVISTKDLKGMEMSKTVDFLKGNMGNASVKVVGNIISSAVEDAIKALRIKITNITVKDGITPFDRYVEVTLDSPNPEKATVTFGDEKFQYNPNTKNFINIITVSSDKEAKDITKYTVSVN